MREIKFRGKRLDNGKWVFGYYVEAQETEACIFTGFYHANDDQPFEHFDVDSKTVCQFTDLCDKNGKPIYEGDIVQCTQFTPVHHTVKKIYKATVEYDKVNPCFVLNKGNNNYEYDFVFCGLLSIEVIGNIHDNPELAE